MSDRIKGFIVSLDKDYRDDDAEVICQALSLIKGVSSVKPLVKDFSDVCTEMRVKTELKNKLIELINEL